MKKAILYRNNNKIYDKAFAETSDKNAHNACNNKASHYFRFSEILHFIDDTDCSILDIGCGNGRLLEFLNFNGYTGKYTGIDINSNLLGEAKKDFPGYSFKCMDFFESMIPKHDYVVLSGTFNANFGQDMAFIYKFIDRMFELSKKKIIFNAISSCVNFRQEEMFYIDPCELIRHSVEKLSPKYEIRHSFVPYNFTMCIHKGKQWVRIETHK